MLKVMYFRKVVVVVEFRRLFILLLLGKKKFPSTLFVIFKILFQVGQKTILVIFFLLARLKWYFVVDVFSFSLYQTFLFFRFITIFFNDFWCHPLFYQLRR